MVTCPKASRSISETTAAISCATVSLGAALMLHLPAPHPAPPPASAPPRAWSRSIAFCYTGSGPQPPGAAEVPASQPETAATTAVAVAVAVASAQYPANGSGKVSLTRCDWSVTRDQMPLTDHSVERCSDSPSPPCGHDMSMTRVSMRPHSPPGARPRQPGHSHPEGEEGEEEEAGKDGAGWVGWGGEGPDPCRRERRRPSLAPRHCPPPPPSAARTRP